MSILEKDTNGMVGDIKKNFPGPGGLLSSYTSALTTAYPSSAAIPAPYKQTDATGIKELTVTPQSTAVITGGGVRVSFDAPNDAVATAWFADATTDSSVLQYVFVPVNTTRTFIFSSTITRWDYVAMAGSVQVYQEKAR